MSKKTALVVTHLEEVVANLEYNRDQHLREYERIWAEAENHLVRAEEDDVRIKQHKKAIKILKAAV